jgi:hypothetical protein
MNYLFEPFFEKFFSKRAANEKLWTGGTLFDRIVFIIYLFWVPLSQTKMVLFYLLSHDCDFTAGDMAPFYSNIANLRFVS